MRPNVARTLVLRESFSAAVDSLYHRHAADIPELDIDDYVSLDWLEWNGGNLRLTTVGENVCRQAQAR